MIDWWSLGIIIYRMLTSKLPYPSNNNREIMKWIRYNDIYPLPDKCSDDAKDLIWRILQRNPEDRLGANGADEIKRHKFFKNIDWEKLSKRQVDSPIQQLLK